MLVITFKILALDWAEDCRAIMLMMMVVVESKIELRVSACKLDPYFSDIYAKNVFLSYRRRYS